jgi:hypothetical protein
VFTCKVGAFQVSSALCSGALMSPLLTCASASSMFHMVAYHAYHTVDCVVVIQGI